MPARPDYDPVLNRHIAELREAVGRHVAELAVAYGIDVPDALTPILPVDPSENPD